MSETILNLYEKIAEQVDIETGSRLSEALHDTLIVLEQQIDAAEIAAATVASIPGHPDLLRFAEAATKKEDKVHETERQVDTIIKNIHKAAVHLIYKARR